MNEEKKLRVTCDLGPTEFNIGPFGEFLKDLREKVTRLELDFTRLDSKYGNNWTEWSDVRESIDEIKALVVPK